MAIHGVKSIHTIVIHCSASREDRDYSFEQLLKDHKARGFTTCGYHIFIRKDGTKHVGRTFDMKGAHVENYNTNTIGICYEGGLDANSKAKDTRTRIQKDELLNSIEDVLRAIELAGGDPKAVTITGHRDLSPDKNGNGVVEPNEWIKMCPCFDAPKEYKDVVKNY